VGLQGILSIGISSNITLEDIEDFGDIEDLKSYQSI
jgi:hypothetical protein